MGQILQDKENEQNMPIFLTFTVIKCFDFFYLRQLSPKLQTALTGALDELEGNKKKENHLCTISKVMGTLVQVQMCTHS